MAIRTFEEPSSGYDPALYREEDNGRFSPGEEPGQMAAQAIDQAKEKAGQAAETAKELVQGQVESKTSLAGGQVTSIAADLRRAAESLRDQRSQSLVADLAERAATTVEQTAGYLESADLETLMEDFKRVGRQRPLAVAGGLFLLGFGASRLIKVAGAGEE